MTTCICAANDCDIRAVKKNIFRACNKNYPPERNALLQRALPTNVSMLKVVPFVPVVRICTARPSAATWGPPYTRNSTGYVVRPMSFIRRGSILKPDQLVVVALERRVKSSYYVMSLSFSCGYSVRMSTSSSPVGNMSDPLPGHVRNVIAQEVDNPPSGEKLAS